MDPLTLFLISQGVSAGAAALDRSRASKQIEEQQGLLGQAETDVQKSFEDLAKEKYKVSERSRQLAKSGQRPTDVSPLLATQATSLEALSTRPDLLRGALPSITESTTKAMTAAQQADLGRELQAESNLAALEQSALTGNIENQRALQQLMLQRAMGSEQAAAQNVEMLEAQKASAIPTAVQSGLQMGTALIPYLKYGGAMDKILADGGAPVVQKLGGEFNHDTNKKAIVDEETGVKEAEATGGEYILNPEQAQGIHSKYEAVKEKMMGGSDLTEEDLMALFEAVDEVFSQPQFNEEKV